MAFTVRATLAALVCVFLAACDSGNDQVQAPDYTQDIVIDIPAVTLSGDFTLNNGNFPVSFYNNGEISLEDTQNLAKTALGETWEGGYSDFVIISGTYDSMYSRLDGILVPQNDDATASSGQLIDMDQAHDVNVPRVIVVPTFTLDGNAFPASVYNTAELFLRPTGSTELISLGTTNLQPSDNVMVVPGVYDVVYSIREGDQLPQNEYAVVIRSEDISTTPHVLNIDIESASFHGTWRLAVDGILGEFPSSVYHSGEYSLQNISRAISYRRTRARCSTGILCCPPARQSTRTLLTRGQSYRVSASTETPSRPASMRVVKYSCRTGTPMRSHHWGRHTLRRPIS